MRYWKEDEVPLGANLKARQRERYWQNTADIRLEVTLVERVDL
jgi:hypothetical protein